MNSILQTEHFRTWLMGLSDVAARAAIVARVKRASFGNFGDVKPVGEGVTEMRIDTGPGYRVYYVRRGRTVYLLLCGGDKKTQKRDIERAIDMARAI